MKSLPEIKRLLAGVSPLSVFNSKSLPEARQAFYELRKKYDFPFWATLEYSVPDKDDSGQLVPLALNSYQSYVIDKILRNPCKERRSLLIICKSVPRCGLTTCIQALITWLQTCVWPSDSVTFSSTDEHASKLGKTLCRCLKQDAFQDFSAVRIPSVSKVAHFSSFQTPSFSWDRKKTGYVHLADMSKWFDPSAQLSYRIFSDSINAIPFKPSALFVMEGDIPHVSKFRIEEHQDYSIPQAVRWSRLNRVGPNPLFLDYLSIASRPGGAIIKCINLDHIPT